MRRDDPSPAARPVGDLARGGGGARRRKRLPLSLPAAGLSLALHAAVLGGAVMLAWRQPQAPVAVAVPVAVIAVEVVAAMPGDERAPPGLPSAAGAAGAGARTEERQPPPAGAAGDSFQALETPAAALDPIPTRAPLLVFDTEPTGKASPSEPPEPPEPPAAAAPPEAPEKAIATAPPEAPEEAIAAEAADDKAAARAAAPRPAPDDTPPPVRDRIAAPAPPSQPPRARSERAGRGAAPLPATARASAASGGKERVMAPTRIAGAPGNPLPSYPFAARRQGLEGKVLLRVAVLPSGAAASVTVESSSGHRILDRAARKAVRRWRFTPATRAGRPVKAEVRVPVTFKLEP